MFRSMMSRNIFFKLINQFIRAFEVVCGGVAARTTIYRISTQSASERLLRPLRHHAEKCEVYYGKTTGISALHFQDP